MEVWDSPSENQAMDQRSYMAFLDAASREQDIDTGIDGDERIEATGLNVRVQLQKHALLLAHSAFPGK